MLYVKSTKNNPYLKSNHTYKFLASYITISGLFLMTSYLHFPMTRMQKILICHSLGQIQDSIYADV